jgi:hypothetical protein
LYHKNGNFAAEPRKFILVKEIMYFVDINFEYELVDGEGSFYHTTCSLVRQADFFFFDRPRVDAFGL